MAGRQTILMVTVSQVIDIVYVVVFIFVKLNCYICLVSMYLELQGTLNSTGINLTPNVNIITLFLVGAVAFIATGGTSAPVIASGFATAFSLVMVNTQNLSGGGGPIG